MKKNVLGLSLCLICSSIFAEAPVVDYSSDVVPAKAFTMPNTPSPVSHHHLTNTSGVADEQRIKIIEQQVNSINEQNLPIRIEELQQTVQQLNGRVEFYEHKLEELEQQIKDNYMDLNQRLNSTVVSPGDQVIDNSANLLQADDMLPATAVSVIKKSEDQAKKRTKNDFLKEQQMYQTAIDLLPEKKNESKSRLRAYLKRYPKGVYVSNSHYWLGEINFLQKDFDAAEEEFKIVIDQHAKSRRVADAMLKLALVHRNQGKEAQAKKELNKVIKKYPGKSAAHLAKQQL